MKRVRYLLFILLFILNLATASADMVSTSELRQQVEAMGWWTQTYDTPNGEVSIDIPVIVPEVENVPILQVSAVMGKDVAEERGLPKAADQENAGAGIFYDDFDILSKLNADVGDAAMIFCANSEKIDLAFLQVSHHYPNSMRRGSWDYSSDYYYLNEVNPEMLFAEENDQPLARLLCVSRIAVELLFVHGIFGKERNRKSGLKFMDTKRFLSIIKMGGSQ